MQAFGEAGHNGQAGGMKGNSATGKYCRTCVCRDCSNASDTALHTGMRVPICSGSVRPRFHCISITRPADHEIPLPTGSAYRMTLPCHKRKAPLLRGLFTVRFE
jgi:hypothetical protein